MVLGYILQEKSEFISHRLNTRKEHQQLLFIHGLLFSLMVLFWLHIVPVWRGNYYFTNFYLNILPLFVTMALLFRLGEACTHINTVLSCAVKAAEARSKLGSDSCTSQKCIWLPSTSNVSVLIYIFSFITTSLHSKKAKK